MPGVTLETEKLPEASVVAVYVDGPFSVTVAFTTGPPVEESVILPETVADVACAISVGPPVIVAALTGPTVTMARAKTHRMRMRLLTRPPIWSSGRGNYRRSFASAEPFHNVRLRND